jgi:exonuclease 3'-5' domain-containing protein 2
MPPHNNQSKLWLIGLTCAAAVSGYLAFRWYESRKKNDDKHCQDDDDDDAPGWYPVDAAQYDRSENSGLNRSIYKEQRRQEKIPLLAMKKPMYDNICMLDPEGTLLCTIGKKKANWYIKKKLAKWKDPAEETTIQLLFEPSHRSNQSQENADDEQDQFFNKSIKENVCVVCGHDEYFMRHYIVPYSCRALFPEKFKMHMAHDVVILCPDCHLECKHIATNRMKFLEKQSRRDPKTAIPSFTNQKLYKVKSVATALLKWRPKLPPQAIDEYEQLVRDHFQLASEDEVTDEILQQATEIETDTPNPDYIPASQVVVEQFCTDDEAIEAFVRGWRKHFVETMQPQHLPKGWSIESSVECMNPERKNR